MKIADVVSPTKWSLPAVLGLLVACGSTDPSNPNSPTLDDPPGIPSQEPLPPSNGNNIANTPQGLAGRTWVKCVDHSSHKLPNHNNPNPSTIPYSKLKFKIFRADNSYVRVDYYMYQPGCAGEIYAKRQYFGSWSFPGTRTSASLNNGTISAQDIDLKITGYWRTYMQTSRGNEAQSYDNSHCRLVGGWTPGVARDVMRGHCARNYGPGKTIYEIVHVSDIQSEGMYFGHTTKTHNGHSLGARPVTFGSHYVDLQMWGKNPPQSFAQDQVRPTSP